MHLVKNDQFVLMVSQVKLRLGKFGPVLLGFQVQINRVPVMGPADLQGKCGLAHLPRPQQCHSG
jgi:hypothetical protein